MSQWSYLTISVVWRAISRLERATCSNGSHRSKVKCNFQHLVQFFGHWKYIRNIILRTCLPSNAKRGSVFNADGQEKPKFECHSSQQTFSRLLAQEFRLKLFEMTPYIRSVGLKTNDMRVWLIGNRRAVHKAKKKVSRTNERNNVSSSTNPVLQFTLITGTFPFMQNVSYLEKVNSWYGMVLRTML